MVMVAVAATKLSSPCVPLFEFDIVPLMFSPPVEEILVESDIVIIEEEEIVVLKIHHKNLGRNNLMLICFSRDLLI